ncbi:hypothetical protein YTPLAS73_00390 [Nitrosarchaeum sp.]|nr:hypothetical protein YTPLAS73_00390 [Nitrosarchaeum sp.]
MIRQSNGDALLEYVDVTGNKKSTNVIIRTDNMTIFSGFFLTSNFKTVINDISKTTCHVDITVDHKDYGLVSSFNSDNIYSKVDGAFQS